MANDLYQLLNIASPEAEAVSRILQPSQAPERQDYSDPYRQSYQDYSRRLNSDEDSREQREQDAEIQRQIALPTMMGKQARSQAYRKALETALYEKQASALMQDLSLLDPADPEHLEHQDEVIGKHGPIAREALKDPRVANLVKRQAAEYSEINELFDKDPQARQEYLNLRTEGKSPKEAQQAVKMSTRNRSERLWFAMNGGDPNEFDEGKFNGPDGTPDKAKMAFRLAQKKSESKSLLSATERKLLDETAQVVGAPDVSDPAKRRAFKAATGRDPATEEDWQSAYSLAEQAGMADAEKLASLVEDLEKAGKSVPSVYKKASTTTSNQNVPRGTIDGPVEVVPERIRVTTQAEYAALPSGTKAIDGKGRLFTKK